MPVVPVVPAPVIAVCRQRGCTLPHWLWWLQHWPGLAALIGGFLVFVVAGWWWAYYW